MKKYKIGISQEVTNGKEHSIFNRSKEEIIFQIILPEEEIDLKAVLRQIVAGKGINEQKNI